MRDNVVTLNTDFKSIAENLLGQIRSLLPTLLPGGKIKGNEYVCGNLRGEPGDSLSVNLTTGAWADFATGEKGGDLISLYAAIKGLTQSQAARELSSLSYSAPVTVLPKKQEPALIQPPTGTPPPDIFITGFGRPAKTWCYRASNGAAYFYVSRYENESGKSFRPWCWSGVEWVSKMWPAPRPLYGLELLKDGPVLITEGEKACDAAREICGKNYSCVTWSGGAAAFNSSDWSVLKNRQILIWPDNDDPGVKAAIAIGNILASSNEVKYIDLTGVDLPKGYDASDALADSWSWETFKTFAKPRVKLIQLKLGQGALTTPEQAALEAPPEPVEFSSREELWDKLELALTDKGVPIPSEDNVVRIFNRYEPLKDFIWFDEFHNKEFTTFYRGAIGNTPRELSDYLLSEILVYLQSALGLTRLKETTVKKAINAYISSRPPRNEPRDWLETLKWDGVDRISNFFHKYLGTEDSDYTRALSKNWWVSIVARALQPGCKVDSMLVLEGAQGIKKSSALEAIGGKWFAEIHDDIRHKDFKQSIQGKLLVEISELDAFSKADINTIKKVITCRVDRFRRSHGTFAADYPRRCVFSGTTNLEEYLDDHTGARRFWPTRPGEIILEAIRQDREQLFAQAKHMYESGHAWWTFPGVDIEEIQSARQKTDTWDEPVRSWIASQQPKKPSMHIHEFFAGILIPTGSVNRSMENRMGGVLRRLGWKSQRAWVNGVQKRMWFSPDFIHVNGSAQPKGRQAALDVPNHAPAVTSIAYESKELQ